MTFLCNVRIVVQVGARPRRCRRIDAGRGVASRAWVEAAFESALVAPLVAKDLRSLLSAVSSLLSIITVGAACAAASAA